MTEQPGPDARGDSSEPAESPDPHGADPSAPQEPGAAVPGWSDPDVPEPSGSTSSLAPEPLPEPPQTHDAPLPPAQAYPGPPSGASAPPPWQGGPTGAGQPWPPTGAAPPAPGPGPVGGWPPPPGASVGPPPSSGHPGAGYPAYSGGQPFGGQPSGYQGAGFPPPGYPVAAGYGPGPATPRTDGKAIVALVLALGSWVLCPLILAIVALVLAGQSNREIAASNGWLEGRTMNTAAKWIAWINIAFFVALAVFLIVVAVVAISSGSVMIDDPAQF